MQASSVTLEQAFSVVRIIVGDYRHLLAKDDLKISVLFRYQANIEQRNIWLLKLSSQGETKIDETFGAYSIDGMDTMDEE